MANGWKIFVRRNGEEECYLAAADNETAAVALLGLSGTMELLRLESVDSASLNRWGVSEGQAKQIYTVEPRLPE
jgi:hypothetical protein